MPTFWLIVHFQRKVLRHCQTKRKYQYFARASLVVCAIAKKFRKIHFASPTPSMHGGKNFSVQLSLCTALGAHCALQRQLIFALQIVLYLHIFLGVDNIYMNIYFLFMGLPANLPVHIVHSRRALIFALRAISRLKFVAAVFVNRRCVNVIGQTIDQVVFDSFLLFLHSYQLPEVCSHSLNGLSGCITFKVNYLATINALCIIWGSCNELDDYIFLLVSAFKGH